MTSIDLRVNEITENDPVARQPRHAKIELKPHQLALLQRCIDYETKPIHLKNVLAANYGNLGVVGEQDVMTTDVGIIGDKVGAGKSYVVLSLASQENIPSKTQFHTQTFCGNKVQVNILNTSTVYQTNIIVIPHNLCAQWKQYVDTFSDNIKYLFLLNIKSLEPFLRNPLSINEYKILFVTVPTHNAIASLLVQNNLKVARVFYDEVDSINIPSAAEIPAKFHWFVTASFGNLLYPRGYRAWDPTAMRYIYQAVGIRNNGFLKNIFVELTSNIHRKLLRILVVKNSDTFVDTCFRMPEPLVRIVLSKENSAIGVLHGLVDREIMQCLNAGDEQTAIQLVDPRRKNTEDNIVNILIHKLQSDLHNLDVQIQAVTSMNYQNTTDQENRLARLKERRDAISAKINSIKERISNTSTCCICFDEMLRKCINKCCSNAFCFTCIHRWLNTNRTCPLCKSVLNIADIYVVDNEVNCPLHVEEDPNENSTHEKFSKLKNLQIILRNRRPGSKFLIFSNYENTFDKIAEKLQEDNIRHAYLKGNKYQIQSKVREYREGDLDILLVNASSYGSGLNLENTTDVVLFHKCDTEIEKQVIGRAQRLGRTQQLNLWYLVHPNEIQAR
jgi:SNF2 family DNA or RNA helicase